MITYLQAITEGLREEMLRDEAVFCLGQDIGTYGGAFRVTKGFLEEFGRPRILDTPLSESAIIGASVGGMTIPWTIGQFFEAVGPPVTMYVILADLALGAVVLAALTWRRSAAPSRPDVV